MMNKQTPAIAQFPFKEGSYEIDRYLFGEETPHSGCWIKGNTSYGDVAYGGQSWATYTRPIFAYLVHTDTVIAYDNSEQTREVSITEGLSKSFTASIDQSYGFSVNFGAINIGSEITSSTVYSEVWSESISTKRSLTVKGPNRFFIYQVHIVYAHLMTSAAKLEWLFKYRLLAPIMDRDNRIVRPDMVYLSSVASPQIVPLKHTNAVSPLSWEQINQAVLFDGFQREDVWGKWSFDYTAANRRR
ncbi:monalysin family beta-barrel pore-forming toxin [Pseudomonas sp. SBB6]|uniref:monalysin family beta-barrel pore-forming toxin n=1 Tax=Pseudomonas sp. SBB6 TaxID=2962032 RepID=UPI0020B6439F|nr:monalysin family beta-barrel pore-forming toxin [Pseudomonas sp. SBB6]MCP3749792.1 monalysin family beta-barrel pore-forming toxin [Pseudomonas sp. SBB6]